MLINSLSTNVKPVGGTIASWNTVNIIKLDVEEAKALITTVTTTTDQ